MRNKFGVTTRSRKPWEQNYGGQTEWDALRVQCYDRDRYQCRDCTVSVRNDPKRSAHHILPLSRGGENKLYNLKTVCGNCHGKHHKHLRLR